MRELIAQEAFIASQIYFIRGQKVIFDSDLAQLYGVSTSRLNEQIKRNINRFPSDFMFQLTETEFKNLISQNAISSWGGRRKLPLVFTEHGALMAASVLNSQAAIDAGIFHCACLCQNATNVEYLSRVI
jgi:ORF6N domain